MEYQFAYNEWKSDFLQRYEQYDQIIRLLAEGDPERIDRYATEYTHTQIAEAYLMKIITQHG